MKITGDIFFDSGNFALQKLTSKMGSKNSAIEFVIDLYLTKWNKAIYSFLPNSFFVQTKINEYDKKQKLIDIYIKGLYDETHKDKLILNGSNSYSNFYPNFEHQKADLDIIINHLFAPLICFRFPKKPLFSLIMSNRLDIINQFWDEILLQNIYKDYPTTLGKDMYDLILHFYKQCKSEQASFDIHSFSNYNQNPQYEVKHFSHDHFRNTMIQRQNKDKKAWDL